METQWKFIVLETGTNYYCVICGCDMHGFEAASYHAIGKSHVDALDEVGPDLTHNGNHFYFCHLCGCNIFGYLNVRCHLKGRRHQDYLNGYGSEMYYSDEDDYDDYWDDYDDDDYYDDDYDDYDDGYYYY